MAAKLNLFVVLLGTLLGLLPLGCGGSTASYTRCRRAAEEGRVVAAEEVRAEDFLAYHATEDAPRPAPGSDLGAPVLLEARVGSASMPGRARAAVQISLRGGVAAARYPSRLVVLVDVSGSMQEGDKIGAVRHALARFVERLDPHDQLAIVTFSDEAHLALPPSVVGEARSDVLAAIEHLTAFGGTNLYAGLSEALVTAEAMRREDVLTRVVLLSDGVASLGITDPAAFEALARQAHDREIGITTVGMGTAIDYALLDTLARTAGGEFHYLDRPAEVERLFSTELVSLVAMAARDVRVRVRMPGGWTLAQSYAERSEVVGDVIETRIGDLPSDGAFVVLHELDGSSPGSIAVEVTLTFADGSSRVVAETSIAVGGAMADDPAVLRNLTLGRCAVAVRSASSMLAQGNAEAAYLLLREASTSGRAAQATLSSRGEAARAASLSEPLELVERTLAAIPPPPPTSTPASTSWTVRTDGPTSERFRGWR